MREYYYELLDDVSVQEDDQEEETLSVDSELIEGKNEATEEEDEAIDQENSPDPDENIAQIYLNEMRKVPLLTREREIELAKRIQLGEIKIGNLILKCSAGVEEIDQLGRRLEDGTITSRDIAQSRKKIISKIIKRLEDLSQAFQDDPNGLKEIVREIKQTEVDVKEAKSEMIRSNLRLVVSIAKIYMNRGLSFLDLIQEGNLGLMKAVSKYDYQRGFKFSTYASWWIRQSISRALADKSRTIRIPVHLFEAKRKTFKAIYELIDELGREPVPEEIASKAKISLNNVLKVMNLVESPISLETPVGKDDNDNKLEDLIGSEECLSLFVESMDLARKTRRILSVLKPRDEQLIRLRFGIGEPASCTLDDIAKRFGISRERVRQIEKGALKRLKNPARKLALFA